MQNRLLGKRILLVEGNPRLREAVRLLLCLEGHKVTEAENGRRACHVFTPGDFDLVITACAMAEMKGDELAKTIKCLVPSQPILMIAAGDSVSKNDAPVDALLHRPFKMAELRQAVSALLSCERPAKAARAGASAGSPAVGWPEREQK